MVRIYFIFDYMWGGGVKLKMQGTERGYCVRHIGPWYREHSKTGVFDEPLILDHGIENIIKPVCF